MLKYDGYPEENFEADVSFQLRQESRFSLLNSDT